MPPCTQYSTWVYKNQEAYGELKIWRGKGKSGTRILDDKAVKFIFLGTGMTEIMPVPRNLNYTVLPAGGLGQPVFCIYTVLSDRIGFFRNVIEYFHCVFDVYFSVIVSVATAALFICHQFFFCNVIEN